MPPSRSPLAGGFPIAALILGGTILGLMAGEPTIGFLVGLALGVTIALWVWWRDR